MSQKRSTKGTAVPAAVEQSEYPVKTDSNQMARAAREMANPMSDERLEEHFQAAMARVYGKSSPQKALP